MELGKLKIPKIQIDPFAFIHDYQTRLFVQYADIVEKTDVGHSVVQSLNEDPRVVALEGNMISQGSHAQRFEVKTLAMWFLWCANEFGLDKTKDYLESFLDSEEINVICTLWVLGIEADQSILIGDGYAIQPLNNMPDSRDKEHFLRVKIGAGLPAPMPKCAITKVCKVKKIDEGGAPLPDSDKEFWTANRQLHEIALLLNALKGVSCLPYYSTSYVDYTIPLGPFGGTGGGFPVYDVLHQRLTKISVDSKAIIDKLLDRFLTLDCNERERIQRILFRLSQAKRRNQIEDKILDLGIALEMILLDNNPNKEQLALSFRLHGSWLIGESAEDRVEKYNQLKEIYRFRSQVAHSGVLCDGKADGIENVRRSFPTYESLAEDICQKIIKEGKPNWKDLILDAT